MDAASTKKDGVCNCEDIYPPHCEPNPTLSIGFRQKKPILKYTKIPDCDIVPREVYHTSNSSASLRVRRVVILDDDVQNTLQFSKTDRPISSYKFAHGPNQNKIYTITEEHSNNITQRRVGIYKKKCHGICFNKAIQAVEESNSQLSCLTTVISNGANPVEKCKNPSKNDSILNSKAKPKTSRTPSPRNNRKKIESFTNRNTKETDSVRTCKSYATPKNCSVKNKCASLLDLDQPQRKKNENIKHISLQKRTYKQTASSRARPLSPKKNLISVAQHDTICGTVVDNLNKQSVRITHVPKVCENIVKTLLDQSKKESFIKRLIRGPLAENVDSAIRQINMTKVKKNKDFGTLAKPESSDIEVATDSSKQVDQSTNMEDVDRLDIKVTKSEDACTNTEKESLTDEFDKLNIPNVSLTIDKVDKSASLPSLRPCGPTTISDESHKLIIPSCPLNVISVFKIGKGDAKEYVPPPSSQILEKWNPYIKVNIESRRQLRDCTSDELMKPSDVISAMRLGSGLIADSYITEQFQMELNFIDSFFESLRYLESCSLSDNSYLTNSKHWIDNNFELDNSMYYDFLSKLENGDESYTVVSKSICLLNLLIRDEHRRAKNLLYVLKMRESALRDFTKSQIIWLENKKKIDKLDISTLKKKQRGALVKLQHECGEMQRIKKALLALSEKRKAALIKTKNNIELKLNNDVNVGKILQTKKRMRKSIGDRTNVPLKCFELSSSGCEEAARPVVIIPPVDSVVDDDILTTAPAATVALAAPATPFLFPTPVPDHALTPVPDHALTPVPDHALTPAPDVAPTFVPDVAPRPAPTLAPAIHPSLAPALDSTLDPALTPALDPAIDPAFTPDPAATADKLPTIFEAATAEDSTTALPDTFITPVNADNNVTVDGGYLNILFQDIKLPQMFSSGKQYEVNREALNKILESDLNKNAEFIEKVKDDVKKAVESTSTPSTARSLVEELDMYYKTLSNIDYSSKDETSSDELECSKIRTDIMKEEKCTAEEEIKQSPDLKDDLTGQTGPLTIPVGAPSLISTAEYANMEDSSLSDHSSTNSNYYEETSRKPSSESAVISNPQCVDYEAESLRQQQLAIEQEIKALEQQQQLLVREIPDKPPPPYTPPTDLKSPRTWRRLDRTTESRVKKIIDSKTCEAGETSDTFELFTVDYCHEVVEKERVNESELPWDACNMMPKKHKDPSDDITARKASESFNEILSYIPSNIAIGHTSRRIDHIDDILFTEWRKLEPEWTSFQVDEAIVKNQVFESIFQKILLQTAEEYKKTVMED